MLIEWVEGEEVVAVIFVLFAAGGDFSGQAIFEIAHQGFKAIEDGDYFYLDGEREKARLSKNAYPIKIRTDGACLRPGAFIYLRRWRTETGLSHPTRQI